MLEFVIAVQLMFALLVVAQLCTPSRTSKNAQTFRVQPETLDLIIFTSEQARVEVETVVSAATRRSKAACFFPPSNELDRADPEFQALALGGYRR